MEKKKFDEIVKDLTELTQKIIDKGNELIQDEKIADNNSYAVKDLINCGLSLLNAIDDIKWLKESNANIIEENYTAKK